MTKKPKSSQTKKQLHGQILDAVELIGMRHDGWPPKMRSGFDQAEPSTHDARCC
jgi:hypothetical protein